MWQNGLSAGLWHRSEESPCGEMVKVLDCDILEKKCLKGRESLWYSNSSAGQRDCSEESPCGEVVKVLDCDIIIKRV